MSVVLGIGMLGHDNGACLVKDGKIVAAVEEERFSRVKHEERFPEASIKFCLDYAGITMDAVDYVARSFLPELAKTHLPHLIPKARMSDYPNAMYFEHHLCHAASTYYTSGFDKAKIITYDGMGEANATVAWDADGDEIVKIHEEPKNNSLGHVFTQTSFYCSFGHFGAGIVMGLSGYGSMNEDLDARISRYLLNPSEGRWYQTKNDLYETPYNLNDASLGFPTLSSLPMPFHPYCDLAYLVQRKFERSLINIVKDVSTREDNMCLSGGCALNCNGNTRVSKYVKDLFIFPAANDGGTAVGAALLCAKNMGDRAWSKVENVYFGPEYMPEQIEVALKASSMNYERVSDISGLCGELVSKGNIIGWFHGRMELGPRALGNRSILADPRSIEVRDRVNKIKQRLWWRPLAPSILDERREEYLEDSFESPFMLHTFKVKENKRDEVKAITHIDYSTRPQTVTESHNKLLYKLIKSFESETNIPMVINTSFNVQEPIVCSPEDAIRAFKGSELDYLAIGDFLCQKKEK